MFGQTAAVYSFLRFSRALSMIAAKLFRLVSVEFFDDFTQIEPKETAESAMSTIEAVFKLLGWKVATSDSKRLDFDRTFISLGAQVCLDNIAKGEIVLSNKPRRVQATCELIDATLAGDF
eukprot:5671661-Karenia_brevis.AAC.1